MTLPLTARFLIATTALAAAGSAHGHTADRYLTWESKAQRTQVAPQAQQPAPVPQGQAGARYGVPASPYGQVGDPYARTLTWPTKPGQRPATQTASIERLPQPTMSAPSSAVSVAVPRPAPRPQPVTVAPVPTPQPSSRPAPTPQPVFDDADEPEIVPRNPAPQAQVQPQTQPQTQPQAQPRVQTQVPPMASARTSPQPQPVATAPAPTPVPLTDGESGYQVPANSKYAARIAAARAAQAQEESMAPTPSSGTDEPPQPSGPAQAAAAPRPVESQSLASHETDQVFIPGEQITNAITQEPRRYSLHRQYGMQPDRIQVDPNPTGAILETRFDALETEDEGDNAPQDSSDTVSGSTP
ncbi:large tegument protein [Asticcacaulis biprosthecium C19]|uniref:Large tegument protein n=1 Tax=Asticcacaulis biprosthecium C19 TaxID=715226 RepID=F4QM71_9CAUL|nr:hypothetical protein [Asticcacaulis biprosthecium]EGF91312.1 large tegument protein [Asticcacaulis biprosthecium C19]